MPDKDTAGGLMTGPDHYREAERLLGEVGTVMGELEPRAASQVAKAQVHAILALAAAYKPDYGTSLSQPGA